MNSLADVYGVYSLGKAKLPNKSTGCGAFQPILLDLYSLFQTNKGKKQILQSRLTLTPRGLIITNSKNEDEFYAITNIILCRPFSFSGLKIKDNKSKEYRYEFEIIKENRSISISNNLLPKKFKYLAKLSRHPPIILILFRKSFGVKSLDVHAFICQNSLEAVTISNYVASAQENNNLAEKQTFQVFDYQPFGIGIEGSEIKEIETITSGFIDRDQSNKNSFEMSKEKNCIKSDFSENVNNERNSDHQEDSYPINSVFIDATAIIEVNAVNSKIMNSKQNRASTRVHNIDGDPNITEYISRQLQKSKANNRVSKEVDKNYLNRQHSFNEINKSNVPICLSPNPNVQNFKLDEKKFQKQENNVVKNSNFFNKHAKKDTNNIVKIRHRSTSSNDLKERSPGIISVRPKIISNQQYYENLKPLPISKSSGHQHQRSSSFHNISFQEEKLFSNIPEPMPRHVSINNYQFNHRSQANKHQSIILPNAVNKVQASPKENGIKPVAFVKPRKIQGYKVFPTLLAKLTRKQKEKEDGDKIEYDSNNGINDNSNNINNINKVLISNEEFDNNGMENGKKTDKDEVIYNNLNYSNNNENAFMNPFRNKSFIIPKNNDLNNKYNSVAYNRMKINNSNNQNNIFNISNSSKSFDQTNLEQLNSPRQTIIIKKFDIEHALGNVNLLPQHNLIKKYSVRQKY